VCIALDTDHRIFKGRELFGEGASPFAVRVGDARERLLDEAAARCPAFGERSRQRGERRDRRIGHYAFTSVS